MFESLSTQFKLVRLFGEVAEVYTKNSIARADVYPMRDVHAFYHLPNGTSIHLQGYPAMSTEEYAYIMGRLMNTGELLLQRGPDCSIGNEYNAVISTIEGCGFYPDTQFPYDATILRKRLIDGVPLLRELDTGLN